MKLPQPVTKNNPKERFKPEVADKLPAKLSKIEVQKKRTSRFSLFVEDEFLIGVSDATLVHFNLRKDTLLTPALLQDIVLREDQWDIREFLIRLLSRRDHARNELRDKALRKGYPGSVIESLLDELTEKGYINNLAFAKKFTHDKFEFNNWGLHKIRIELIKKGISEKDIQIALEQIPGSEVDESILELVLKNKRKFQRAESFKRKKKVFDFLLRKGYDSDTIFRLMPDLLNQIES